MTALRTGNSRRRKISNAAVVVSLSTALGLSASLKATEKKNRTAGETFKNVQVLKDISADDLLPSMQFITASLGVECEFCHVHNAFEKDDKKPKQTARKMMQMMFTINQQNFNGQGQVSCYTCHRGATTPMAIPAIGDTQRYASTEDSSVPTSGLPAASEVLDRYVAALGGAAAIEKVSVRIESGTVRFASGPPIPVQIMTKAPLKQIMIVHLVSGDAKTVFTGTSGWTSSPGAPVREMHAADFEGATLDADLQLPLHLKKVLHDLKSVKVDTVGDRKAVVLVGSSSAAPIELFFDKDSALLLRELRFSKSPLGLNPTRIDFDDYRDFDGVKVPVKVTISRPRTQMELQFDDVKQNVPVEDSVFEPPPATQAVPAGK